jgi:hypothetical protein
VSGAFGSRAVGVDGRKNYVNGNDDALVLEICVQTYVILEYERTRAVCTGKDRSAIVGKDAPRRRGGEGGNKKFTVSRLRFGKSSLLFNITRLRPPIKRRFRMSESADNAHSWRQTPLIRRRRE